MGDGDLGNVVLSRPFQFAEILNVVVDRDEDGDVFTPSLPNKYQPIKDRYIYAFELGERDSDMKPMLTAEYHADAKGKLTYVPGAKRRKVNAKENGPPAGTSVPAAALPLVRQGQRLRHFFVAIRGRLSKAGIADMENGVHPIYERLNLADDFYFKDGGGGVLYIPIIDPLTLGEQLSIAYHKALNDAANYIVPYKKNPDKAAVELRARKYRLAKMIKDTLLEPEGRHHDPLEIQDCLANRGHKLLNFIDQHESKLRRLAGQKEYRADQLVRLLNSSLWIDAYGWYLGDPPAAMEIGHCWLDASFCSIDRLGETRTGRRLQAQLIKDADRGLLSYLIAPEEESDLGELYEQRFPIMRKAATAAVIGLAEMAPALAVSGQIRNVHARIKRTVEKFLGNPRLSISKRYMPGKISEMLKNPILGEQLAIDLGQARVDLSKWIEEGKPHWPERTKPAELSELVGRLFICVELTNLFNTFVDFAANVGGQPVGSDEKWKASIELFGATLDVVVAAEDPIRAYARQLDGMRRATPVAEGAAQAAGEAGATEEEAMGIFGELTKPMVFKFLGAASAAIDAVMYAMKAYKAAQHGDRASAYGYLTVASGSAVIFGTSVVAGIGYATEAAALTAAAASLMVVGVIIVVVGFTLVHFFSKTSWQTFARHCIFGDEPGKAGHETWSGGDFAEWTETIEGIDKQIQVLTGMLCAFQVKGAGLDDHSIFVEFCAVPPQAKLELEFLVSYENGQKRRLGFTIDLETGARQYRGDAKGESYFAMPREEGRVKYVSLRTEGPPFSSGVEESSCSVRLLYAPGNNEKITNGRIPIEKPCEYVIRDSSWGMGHMEPVNSIDVGPED